MSQKLSKASLTAILIMAVDDLHVDRDTLELMAKIDAGEITHEQAIQLIKEACEKLPSKRLSSQDVHEFFED